MAVLVSIFGFVVQIDLLLKGEGELVRVFESLDECHCSFACPDKVRNKFTSVCLGYTTVKPPLLKIANLCGVAGSPWRRCYQVESRSQT